MEASEDPGSRPVSGFDLLHIPYEERWEHFKTLMVNAYFGKDETGGLLTFPKLAEFMKDNHGFSAEAHQYQYRFKKWEIRKRTTTAEKKAIVAILGKRPHAGASTSNVTIRQGGVDKQVDKKQIKRFLKDEIRRHAVEPLSPGMFAEWNLPYDALIASIPKRMDHPSPFGPTPATPHYLNINSPEAITPGSQRREVTPTAAIIKQSTLQTRSNLLLQGRREELLSGCNARDRRVLSGWLHDYWMHSFVTAKFWGRGPTHWTAFQVSEITLGARASDFPSPLASSSPAGSIFALSPRTYEIPRPTGLCQWAIHHAEDPSLRMIREKYDRPIEEQAECGLDDQSLRTPWSHHDTQNRTLQASMEMSFTSGQFSRTSSEKLPIFKDTVAQAVSRSPDELALDSVAFAIMSGNLESVEDTLASKRNLNFNVIQPYHLAASFLDGGHSCCLVINDLIRLLEYDYPIALNNIDNDGHTVLDSLMVSILRSHTNVTPADVSSSFKNLTRFPGEEKDICGRWDADSPAVCLLHIAGQHRIPQHWKHNFCHSAIQAVCHSMLSIFVPPSAPKVDTLSGLFRRRCTQCGLEMKLGPLHVIVMVAYYLAERGMDGETLFGAVACAVCLLVLGGDAALTANLSDKWFMLHTSTEGDECRHHPVTAAQFAEQVPRTVIDRWKPLCRIGWRCLFLILQRAERLQVGDKDNEDNTGDEDGNDDDDEDDDDDDDEEEHTWCSYVECEWNDRLPCIPYFGTLWASIQTEILTHRKITNLDQSISTNFRMDSLARWLEWETDGFQTPLVDNKMMQAYSECGWFRNAESGFVSKASDVSSHYFMNLDIWARATFIRGMVFGGL